MPKIWLDDLREVPKIYVDKELIHVRTAHEAIELLRVGDIEFISLDHDLGEAVEGMPDPGNGYEVATFIEEAAFHGTIPQLEWNVHSANSAAVPKMIQALNNANDFWKRRG